MNIKEYFSKRKKRKHLQKLINHEIVETLASICLYLKTEGTRTHNSHTIFMYDHYITLKELSKILREEIHECNGKITQKGN
jgi:hypothetical protein